MFSKYIKRNRVIFLMVIFSCMLISSACSMTSKKDKTPKLASSENEKERKVDKSVKKPYLGTIQGMDDRGIHVYWKKPEGTNGYELFRSYSEYDDYTHLTDVKVKKNGSYGEFYDESFDHDKKTVYYIVCSFKKNADGSRTYSEFSNIIRARFREELKITREKIFIPSGNTRIIKAYYGWGLAKDVEFSSSDSSVASVDDEGVITGIAKGTATITVKDNEVDQSKECVVTIDREAEPLLDEYKSRYVKGEDGIYYNPSATKSDEAILTLGGDMMCMAKQQRALQDEDGNFNFNCSYDYVKPIYEDADFNIANLETVIDPAWSYYCEEGIIDNFPNCNAPATYLDALKYAGIDGVVTTNNHNCDAGVHGVIETVKQLERYDIPSTGIRDEEGNHRYLIVDVNGIKVGFLSYTDSFNTKDYSWDEKDVETYLNHYGTERARKDIENIRKLGAEYVIAYMHWGTKNCRKTIQQQEIEARELAAMGVDYIAGSHCHLVQKFEYITGKNGKKVPCVFCFGDYNTSINQIKGNRDSIITRLVLKRQANGKIVLSEHNYIPFYCYSSYKDGHYVTIPLNPNLNGGLTDLYNEKKIRRRIKRALGRQVEEYMPN